MVRAKNRTECIKKLVNISLYGPETQGRTVDYMFHYIIACNIIATNEDLSKEEYLKADKDSISRAAFASENPEKTFGMMINNPRPNFNQMLTCQTFKETDIII